MNRAEGRTQQRVDKKSEGAHPGAALGNAEEPLTKKQLTRLVRRSMRGEEEAFVKLYGHFLKEVHYVAGMMLDNKEELDDVVQEVAAGLYKSITKLQSPYAFYTYLLRIIKNICMQHNLQQRKKQHSNLDNLEQEPIDDIKYTPEAVSDEQSLADAVWHLVQQLPEKQRLSLLLYYYRDMSYKEIAEVTDTSVSAVGTNISKAKKALKIMIEAYNNKNKDNEVFHGVALGPLLAGAFATGIDSSLPNAAAAQLLKASAEQVHHLAPLVGTRAGASSSMDSLAAKVAMVVVGVALAGSLAVGILLTPQGEPIGSGSAVAPNGAAAPRFEPQVTITLETASSTAGHPTHATIEVEGAAPVLWSITLQGEGSVVASGEGASIEETTFASLASGSYVIEWLVQNEAGESGIASRAFTLKR